MLRTQDKTNTSNTSPFGPTHMPEPERLARLEAAKNFIRKSGGQKRLIPLLGTFANFMTPEEQASMRRGE